MIPGSSASDRSRLPVISLVPFSPITFGLAWGILALFIFLPVPMNAMFGKLPGQVDTGKNSANKPEVFLIGTIHEMHLDPANRYSIPDLLAQIAALRPDIVCGEITPEAFGGVMEGYFPPEAACLAQMAAKMNYRFVPVDWRLDSQTQSKAEREFPEEVKVKMQELVAQGTAHKKADLASAYDFFNGKNNLETIDRFFEEIVGKDPVIELAQGAWHRRNRTIVENGLAAAGPGQRVVFALGSDHLPGLQRELKARGVEAVIAKRQFVPCNSNRVDDDVRQRWQRNLDNLRNIRAGLVQTSEDNVLKAKNSKRPESLQKAIDRSR